MPELFPNITIGGGSQFTAYLMQLLDMLGQQRTQRAGLGSDLFSSLLGAQLEANRRPISLVDQLLLSGQVGSALPLSQASQELHGQFTSRPQSNLLNDLQRRLEMFTVGALTPTQQVGEGFNPQTGVRLSQAERDYIRALARQQGQEPGQFADEPRRMQFGGRLRIDPNAALSTRRSVAGPASVVDRSGRQVALMAEAGKPETMSVSGAKDVGEAPGVQVGESPQLRADEQIRFEEISRVRPDLPFEVRVNIARFPGGFEQWVGIQTDPRVASSRYIGGAIASDQRYSPTLQRSLALGRTPSPSELTAEDIASLPPYLQDSLIGLLGSDRLFELGAMTPRGRRTGIAGPVRIAA